MSCTAALPEGGSQAYTVTLAREGIGWKVTDVQLAFDSSSNAGTGTSSTSGTVPSDAGMDAGAATPDPTSTDGTPVTDPSSAQ